MHFISKELPTQIFTLEWLVCYCIVQRFLSVKIIWRWMCCTNVVVSHNSRYFCFHLFTHYYDLFNIFTLFLTKCSSFQSQMLPLYVNVSRQNLLLLQKVESIGWTVLTSIKRALATLKKTSLQVKIILKKMVSFYIGCDK